MISGDQNYYEMFMIPFSGFSGFFAALLLFYCAAGLVHWMWAGPKQKGKTK